MQTNPDIAKAQILFVDDEPNILRGLQRMLRHKRDLWEISYACGGSEALDILNEEPVDIVVSDLRMPGMSGSQLLSLVRIKYPQIVRMALSGQAELEQVIQTSISAHQFLSKPCDAEFMSARLTRICKLVCAFSNQKLANLVCPISSLPSMPDIHANVKAIVDASPDALLQAGRVVATDLGMSTKVLQLANSSILETGQQICDPIEAVMALGHETLKSLIDSQNVFTILSDAYPNKSSMITLWKRSLRASKIAYQVAEAESLSPGDARAIGVAAFLHDLAKLIISSSAPDKYEEVLALCRDEDIDYEQAVMLVFGVGHDEISKSLMSLWSLSEDLVDLTTGYGVADTKPISTLRQAIVHFACAAASECCANDREFRPWAVNIGAIEPPSLRDKVVGWQNIKVFDTEV